MKKIYFICMVGLLLSAMMLGFSGCSDDDEEGTSGSSSELVGTWEIVHYKYQWKENGKVVDEDERDDSNTRLSFHENGTCEGAEYYNGKWNWGDKGTWKYKGGKLEITYEEEGDTYKESAIVKTLTASKLVVEFTDKFSEDGIDYEDYSLQEYKKIAD